MQRTESGVAALKSQLGRAQELPGHAHHHREGHAGQPDHPGAAAGGGEQVGRRQRQLRTRAGSCARSRPTSQAGKAVAFVYAQLGCPYVYGATGPCHDGFDCSGLVQAAWASAGVPIPRDTYEDWAELPHVSLSALEPGDLILYDGEGHVAMYVGDGYIIDAPQTGLDVERIPMSTAWYADNTRRGRRPVGPVAPSKLMRCAGR